MPARPTGVADQIKALRERLDLIWANHEREHAQHEEAHAREHSFAQKAIDTAAELAKENKSDANEWREAMNDRERTFATKEDVGRVLERLDHIEKAGIVATERERERTENETEDKRQAERRVTRSQWTIGLVVGALASIGAILVNAILRLSGSSSP